MVPYVSSRSCLLPRRWLNLGPKMENWISCPQTRAHENILLLISWGPTSSTVSLQPILESWPMFCQRSKVTVSVIWCLGGGSLPPNGRVRSSGPSWLFETSRTGQGSQNLHCPTKTVHLVDRMDSVCRSTRPGRTQIQANDAPTSSLPEKGVQRSQHFLLCDRSVNRVTTWRYRRQPWWAEPR